MGKTIMISSHILSELEEMCNHVGIIEHGKLVFTGTMEEIRRRLGVSAKVRVQVAGDAGRAVELLSALPQVSQARQVDDYITVTFADDSDNNGLIARTLVQGNFDIITLQPEQVKLDQAFLQLTKGIVH
ncbi:hypothetical protein ACFL02_04410 [Planctomycetota bacterium]